MMCSECQEKQATVHVTRIVGNTMQQLDLCAECAKQKGVDGSLGFSLADLLRSHEAPRKNL
jgi:protein arginine kinase activator